MELDKKFIVTEDTEKENYNSNWEQIRDLSESWIESSEEATVNKRIWQRAGERLMQSRILGKARIAVIYSVIKVW